MMHHHHGKFYGSTVMGERGQVVIPVEARGEIGIESGEKLVVFGNKRRGVVILFKSEVMTRFADMMFRKSKFFEEMFNFSGDSKQDAKEKNTLEPDDTKKDENSIK